MKSLLLAVFAVSVSLCSCNDEQSKTTNLAVNDPQSVDVKGVQQNVKKDRVEELKEMEVIDLLELQKMLPETIDGHKQKNFSSNLSMGYAFAQANYKKDKNSEFQVVLYDCAGEAGSAWYQHSYQDLLKPDVTTDDGYTKTIEFKGEKAIERYSNNKKLSELSFLKNGRILVVMTGLNMKAEELRAVAEKLG